MTSPTLSTIAQSIIDQLAPLQNVGLTVRRQPNRLRSQGAVTGNGVITLSLESVTGGTAERDLSGAKQSTIQVWLLRGTLRNLREQDGLNNLYDWLTENLFGWTPDGASGPITLGTFTPQPPTEDYYIVEMRLNVPAVLIQANDTFALDVVPEANGANLLEAIFEVAEVKDQWGVYSDTTEVNPC